MPFLDQPYEKLNSTIHLLGSSKNDIVDDFLEIHKEARSAPDIDLPTEDSLLLVRWEVDNLRQKIGKSIDEIIKLRELEAIVSAYDDGEAIPENLGKPSKSDTFISSLETKRTDLYQNQPYDGGNAEVSDSSINQYYTGLFQDSYLNIKSLEVLSAEKKPIVYQNGKVSKVTLFDCFKNMPKLTFEEYLAKVWKVAEKEVHEKLKMLSEALQRKLKENWRKYLEERQRRSPAPFSEVIQRCKQLAESPIYEGKKEIGREYWMLEYGIELRFTDETAVFTIPIEQFDDIPRKSEKYHIAYLQVSFVLPLYAREKQRFFKKGGKLKEFQAMLEGMEADIDEKWLNFLTTLASEGALRLYREVLEKPDHDRIRGYFLSISSGVNGFSKSYLTKILRNYLSTKEKIHVRNVSQFQPWFPEWMRKIGGIIIEHREGQAVKRKKPKQLSVDTKLPSRSYLFDSRLMPNESLLDSHISTEEWQKKFLEQLRTSYKANPQIFKRYAEEYQKKRIEIKCACQGKHEERCVVPLLNEVFAKIFNS